MNDKNQPATKRATPWGGAFFSARFFLVRALVIGVLFLLVHLAGWREHTTFLSGTTGDAAISFRLSAFYGMVYLALYLGCVVVSPILIGAAGLLWLWGRRGDKTEAKQTSPDTL